ncbi:hypothetical protein EDD85DRAFT_793331 [Armillaria nabsnona]|nr:hypothetical protein EDD85DRAFT_793331 [Armillaria nabsnona]
MKHIFQAFSSNASVPDSSQEHVMEGGTIDPEELMLQYPWSVTGGVGIKREDFNCLKPGVYLNDNLIEFGLWLLQEQLGQDKFAINKDIYVFMLDNMMTLDVQDQYLCNDILDHTDTRRVNLRRRLRLKLKKGVILEKDLPQGKLIFQYPDFYT